MKKNLIACAVLCTLFLGCDKKDEDPAPTTNTDTTAPTMVLNGKANDTIVLNSTYSDPGATATDNVDGNISNNVVASGNLDVNQAGDYVKKYNVKDAAGNSAPELSRKIHVRNEAYFLAGSYAVAPNCGSTPASNYNTSVSVSATVNRLFTFSTLQGNYTGATATATLGAGNNTYSLTPLSGNNSLFSGSGNVGAFGITGLSAGIQPQNVVGVYYCTSIFVKQ